MRSFICTEVPTFGSTAHPTKDKRDDMTADTPSPSSNKAPYPIMRRLYRKLDGDVYSGAGVATWFAVIIFTAYSTAYQILPDREESKKSEEKKFSTSASRSSTLQ
jgi:hypothetical protein